MKSADAKMEIKLICDKEVGDKKLTDVHTGKGEIIATMRTKYACPSFNFSYIFDKYPYIFSIIFIAGGILCAFLGQRLFPWALFILAFFTISFVLIAILYGVALSSTSSQMAFWIVLGISGVVGLTGGYFIKAYHEYCFVLAGGALGGIAGFFIYNLFLVKAVPPVTMIF